MSATDLFLEQALDELEQLRKENQELKEVIKSYQEYSERMDEIAHEIERIINNE